MDQSLRRCLLSICILVLMHGTAWADRDLAAVRDEAAIRRIEPEVAEMLSLPKDSDLRITRILPWYGCNVAEIKAGRLLSGAKNPMPLTAFVVSLENRDVGLLVMTGKRGKLKFSGLYDGEFRRHVAAIAKKDLRTAPS